MFLLGLALLLTAARVSAQPADPDLAALAPCAFASRAGDDIANLDVGAVVLNLRTGTGCADDLDTTFHVASVPKLFVAATFLEKVARGELSFETAVIFSEDYYMGGSTACMTEAMIGTSVTYGYLSDIMISCSDNSATWMLMDIIGWQSVQAYITRLGIPGIGPVIPYSEVDRLKLIYLDERWANVPRGLAAQFYRERRTRGLVPQYFRSAPNYTREQRIAANNYYFETYFYNTITPRAMIAFLLKLRADVQQVGTVEAQTAWWLFNTMLLTQRQFSTQALPGTVFVGAKNGFDFGLRAEVNVLFPVLWTLDPEAFVVVFTQQRDLTGADFEAAGPTGRRLSDYLRTLSADISTMLYPQDFPPTIVRSSVLTRVVFNYESWIENCVDDSVTINDIEACWLNLAPNRVRVGEQLGMGLILRGMAQQTQRLTFLYTAPDGRRFSYQYTIAERDDTYMFWFHVPDADGVWQVDIYLNLQRVHSSSVLVEG